MSIRTRSLLIAVIAIAVLGLLLASGFGTVASLSQTTQVIVLIYALAIAATSATVLHCRLSKDNFSLAGSSPDVLVAGAGLLSRPFLC